MTPAARAAAIQRIDLLLAELRASANLANDVDFVRQPNGDYALGACPIAFVGTMQARLKRWEREIADLRALLAPAPRAGGLGERPNFEKEPTR